MSLSELKSSVQSTRVRGILGWIALLPFTMWALRNTVINGITYPLSHGRFHGDFSSALFNVGWVDGLCIWPAPLSQETTAVAQYGTYERSVEILYGPIFTFAQHLFLETSCPPFTLIAVPRFDINQFLTVVTIANLCLIVACVLILAKLLTMTSCRTPTMVSQATVIATLWLLDNHLSYSISVAAIPELTELMLILLTILFLIQSTTRTQILAGSFLGVAAMTKLVPIVLLPLMIFRRSYTTQRILALFGTVLLICTLTSRFLGISLTKTFGQTFIPAGRELLSPTGSNEFRGLSDALARILDIPVPSRSGTILGVICTVILISLYCAAVGYTVIIRRRVGSHPDNDIPGLFLLVGLYCSLISMTGIVHKHTYLFLIPTFTMTFYVIRNVFVGRIAVCVAVVGTVLYLWSTQALLASVLIKVSIPVPSLLLEEALPNLGFVVLFIAMIHFREVQKRLNPATE